MGVAATSLSTALQSISCMARPQVGQENRPWRTWGGGGKGAEGDSAHHGVVALAVEQVGAGRHVRRVPRVVDVLGEKGDSMKFMFWFFSSGF